jgi:hypothetical protein
VAGEFEVIGDRCVVSMQQPVTSKPQTMSDRLVAATNHRSAFLNPIMVLITSNTTATRVSDTFAAIPV